MVEQRGSRRCARPGRGGKTATVELAAAQAPTAPPSAPAPARAGSPARRRRRRRLRVIAWLQLAVLILLLAGAGFAPAPFLLHHPGVVIDATQHLRSAGGAVPDPRFGTGGSFLLTTQRTTPLTWGAYAWYSTRLPSGAEIVPIPPAAPRSHYDSLAAMDQSKDIAAAVAGCVVHGCTPKPVGARVVSVTDGSPAADAGLQAGDVIVAARRLPEPRAYADDTTAPALTSLPAILQILRFAEDPAPIRGQRAVGVDVLRGGAVVPLTIVADGGPLGADVVTAWVGQRALEVGTGRVGGPSTGLMLTLTLVDALTVGDLTGGRRVAGTGTIAADGTVGPIGGVEAKVVGAVRAGAQVFLVPPVNAAEARAAAPPSLEVVETRTLAAALTWLCRTAACPPPTPPLLAGPVAASPPQ